MIKFCLPLNTSVFRGGLQKFAMFIMPLYYYFRKKMIYIVKFWEKVWKFSGC